MAGYARHHEGEFASMIAFRSSAPYWPASVFAAQRADCGGPNWIHEHDGLSHIGSTDRVAYDLEIVRRGRSRRRRALRDDLA
jgi:hypothetical protein